LQISNPEHISYNQGQKTIINNFNNVDKELSNSNNFIISSSNINLNENKNYQENSFNNIINKNKENQNFILNKNESEKQNLNENKKKEIINKEEMTNEEIEKAKENGYILIGKTGVGKTSLLNILYGKKVGKVGYSTKSETNESNYYCIKEKLNSDYIYFCLVDTPGLYDTNSRERDKIQKEQIIKLISETKIKIKGLFFLSNFQNERFDFSEQNSLLEYNSIFPLKEFWKRIIFIFTHYYGDPDGDSEEEIKKRAEYTLSKIFQEIMNKVQGVSDTLSFTLINKKYINIYSKEKNKKQCENNLKVRNELIRVFCEKDLIFKN
jgi:GTP-binding protein EngB required for normal cell division